MTTHPPIPSPAKPSDHLRKVMSALQLAERIIDQSGLCAGAAHIEIRQAKATLPSHIKAVEAMETFISKIYDIDQAEMLGRLVPKPPTGKEPL
jgi:hypothetical protein